MSNKRFVSVYINVLLEIPSISGFDGCLFDEPLSIVNGLLQFRRGQSQPCKPRQIRSLKQLRIFFRSSSDQNSCGLKTLEEFMRCLNRRSDIELQFQIVSQDCRDLFGNARAVRVPQHF